MKEAASEFHSITVETMDHTEIVVIRAAQAINFDEEIKVLTLVSQECATSKNYFMKKSSSLYKFEPFLDSSGVLRVSGWLKFTEMSDHVKFPIIIPGKVTLPASLSNITASM